MKCIFLLICLTVLVSQTQGLILDKMFNILPPTLKKLVKKVVHWACPNERAPSVGGGASDVTTTKKVTKTVKESRK
uniref:Uncharacterized protein n=1 Tax=Trichobilharzia regenti TaxID=157069 RepID=A0AA85KNL7_TRIRE|nr:unnamed protein product [Trichobilharzia regenti]